MNTDRKRNPGRIRVQSILVTALIAVWLILPAYAADTEAEDPACASVSSTRQTEKRAEAKDAGARQTEQQKTEQSEQEKPGPENVIAEGTGTEGSETEAVGREPEGDYTVIVQDIHADLPEEGRVYDGTNQITLAYTVQTAGTPAEGDDIPAYTLNCEARLDGCDAGERKVLYSFSLQTPYPEHVRLKEDQEYPPITVEVKKAVLSVRIADGTKKYMDPADLEHIGFVSDRVVEVTGFVKDEAGKEVIPEGLRLPEIEVDSNVLRPDSPMYQQGTLHRYEKALILKKTAEGNVTGNPTGNYEFCCDPEDDRYVPGTVTVTRGEIRAGEDYTVKGEADAFLPDGRGGMILRAGSCLHVEPCRGSGYNTGVVSEGLSGEGWYSFCLQKKDRKGRVTAESEEERIHYSCDAAAPAAVLSITGAAGDRDIRYTASEAYVAADVPADDMSGIRSVRYRLLHADLKDDRDLTDILLSAGEWQDPGSSLHAKLTREGICRIEWEVSDGVGNTNRTISPLIVVDHTAPRVTIRGVTDNSSHAGEVIITVACRDAAYRPGSLSAHLSAAHQGQIPDSFVTASDPHGATVRFSDFQHSVQADNRYTLEVRAQDLAGNETVRRISFTINRFGSSYRLGKHTEENLRTYYHQEPFAVCFTETNPDPVTRSRICILRDGVLTRLIPGNGDCSVKTALSRGRYRYSYTISADAFRKEGRYEVLLLSEDAAGHTSDSASQGIAVRFAIDRTPPQCRISGIRTGGKYDSENLTAVLEISDNIALAAVQIYRDSILAMTLDEDAVAQAGGAVKLSFGEKKEWQTLQVHAADHAGNEYWTEEYVFLVRRDASDAAAAIPEKKPSARQVQLVRQWIGTWRSRLQSMLRPGSRRAGGKGRLIYNPDDRLKENLKSISRQYREGAGSLKEGRSVVQATDLQRKRFRNLLRAAAVLLLMPLLYLFMQCGRECADRRRRGKPVDRTGTDG